MSISSVFHKSDQSHEKRRILYFDALRAFACLSVVMIHVSTSFAMKEVGSIDFWAGNFCDSISRGGTPLFVMLSGALMLDENYVFTTKKWIKHIQKMLIFFLFWSSMYCIGYQVLVPIIEHREIDPIRIAWSILNGHFHLWFVPMIIGLYFLVPLLRLWVKQANRLYVEYFLLLSLFFSFLAPHCVQIMTCINPIFDYLKKLVDNIQMKYTLGFISYFVLGWYLHNFELPKKNLFYVLGITGVCITILGTYGIFKFTSSKNFVFYDSFSVNVLLYSVAIFLLFKSCYSHRQYKSTTIQKAIDLISGYSLGVYAVHMFVIDVLSDVLSRFMYSIHVFVAIPSVFLLTVIISLLSSYVIKQIPFIRNTI